MRSFGKKGPTAGTAADPGRGGEFLVCGVVVAFADRLPQLTLLLNIQLAG